MTVRGNEELGSCLIRALGFPHRSARSSRPRPLGQCGDDIRVLTLNITASQSASLLPYLDRSFSCFRFLKFANFYMHLLLYVCVFSVLFAGFNILNHYLNYFLISSDKCELVWFQQEDILFTRDAKLTFSWPVQRRYEYRFVTDTHSRRHFILIFKFT
jgi:hypothetical protein